MLFMRAATLAQSTAPPGNGLPTCSVASRCMMTMCRPRNTRITRPAKRCHVQSVRSRIAGLLVPQDEAVAAPQRDHGGDQHDREGERALAADRGGVGVDGFDGPADHEPELEHAEPDPVD